MNYLITSFTCFFSFTLVSCSNNDFSDKINIFESASKSDSLSYYFPAILSDTFESRNPEYKDFTQKWYSSSLYSFKEPILYTKTDLHTIYRLLWLRSFHKPVCFTVKEFKGRYFLNTKTLDRQPAFHNDIQVKDLDKTTGKAILDMIQKADRFALIDFNTIKVLTGREWNEIERRLSVHDFWNSSITDPVVGGEISTDGAEWILEGRKNGKYHFIKRHDTKKHIKELGKYLIKLSGLDITKEEIY